MSKYYSPARAIPSGSFACIDGSATTCRLKPPFCVLTKPEIFKQEKGCIMIFLVALTKPKM